MEYDVLDCFMISLFCGVIYGVVYEAMRIIRRIIPLYTVTFICDILFFIGAAFVVTKLSLYLGNYIRGYTIIGFGLGTFAYIQTIGRLAVALEKAILLLFSSTVGRFLKLLFNLFTKGTAKLFRAFAHITTARFRKINNFLKKTRKNTFSLLKKHTKKLYNDNRQIVVKTEDRFDGENIGGANVIYAKIRRSKR